MLDLATIERLLESVTGIFLVVKPGTDFSIVAASADFLTTTRADASMFGKPLFEVFPDNPQLEHADGSRNLRASLQRVIQTKTRERMPTQRYDIPLPKALGGGFEERYWNITVMPLLDQDGDVQYILNQVEEASAKHNRDAIKILESITEGFFTLDRNWRFDYVNQEAHRILDRTVGELAGKVLWEVYPGLEGTEFEKSYHQTMYRREKSSFVAFYPNQQRWYDVTVFPAPEGISIYFRNVTDEKNNEAERQAAEQALREHAKRLADADTAKDEFLATLSHELRNPLAPLRTAIELLQKSQADDPRSSRLHTMMGRQITHMVRLVDDLLEMSRISRGAMSLQKTRLDLASVVSSAVETSEPLIKAARHEFSVELPSIPVHVEGDAVRLAQVLTNLLNNAAKYTDDGGRIALRAAVDGSFAVITVQDNGLGITADQQPRVFEMFSRGDRLSARHQGGLGIGLAISRRLAEMHDGTLTVASKGAGLGSEFTLRLALAAEPAPTEIPHTDASASFGRLKVLLVDDNRDAADSLAMVLEQLQSDVRVAYSGPQGLELLTKWKPDIALLDIGMPVMNGYEVARAIRLRFPYSPPKLVAITGWGLENDRKQAREAGFDHHYVKPVEVEVIEQLLNSLRPATR